MPRVARMAQSQPSLSSLSSSSNKHKSKNKSKKRSKLLASTRPTIIKHVNNNSKDNTKISSSVSSRTTQTIISTHHTLHKQLAQAKKENKSAETIAAIEAAIEANGGLKLYQRASITGQSRERGGDTSKVLVDWLGLNLHSSHKDDDKNYHHHKQAHHDDVDQDGKDDDDDSHIRILEVGALSATNAINIPGITQVRRIDLHSQDPKTIEQMDFMDLDPKTPWQAGGRGALKHGYHILSLSLVLNYVSDPVARGDMLKHTVEFLLPLQQQQQQQKDLAVPVLVPAKDKQKEKDKGQENEKVLPALFLVLPRPCIDNSRYLSEERLVDMMNTLGYQQSRVKRSPRLYYSLWTLRKPPILVSSDKGEEGQKGGKQMVFKKVEIRSGKDRNNFSVVLA